MHVLLLKWILKSLIQVIAVFRAGICWRCFECCSCRGLCASSAGMQLICSLRLLIKTIFVCICWLCNSFWCSLVRIQNPLDPDAYPKTCAVHLSCAELFQKKWVQGSTYLNPNNWVFNHFNTRPESSLRVSFQVDLIVPDRPTSLVCIWLSSSCVCEHTQEASPCAEHSLSEGPGVSGKCFCIICGVFFQVNIILDCLQAVGLPPLQTPSCSWTCFGQRLEQETSQAPFLPELV